MLSLYGRDEYYRYQIVNGEVRVAEGVLGEIESLQCIATRQFAL